MGLALSLGVGLVMGMGMGMGMVMGVVVVVVVAIGASWQGSSYVFRGVEGRAYDRPGRFNAAWAMPGQADSFTVARARP